MTLLLPGVLWSASPDNAAFSLECPPDVTISCEDDTYNLDKYGTAYVHDYSGRRPAGKPKVVKDLNGCGKGTITRTWTVEDYNWNIHTCSQTIFVTGGGLSEDDIIWPRDYNLEGCHPSTDPRKLPVENGYPRYTNTDCAQPMASYKDEVFEFSKSCKKVIRKWTVIDWCEYSPNKRPLPGYFTYYQIIKVSASDKPTIVCPPDSIYLATKDCDSTTVQLDPVRAFTTCDSNLTIRHNSPYALRQGADASGTYPVGTTKVTFHIEYGCGKDTSCTVEVTVKPDKAPVPYCRDGIITTLMGVDTDNDGVFDEGMVEIWAKDLDIGSYHPCGNIPLTFSFDPDSVVMSRVFTCDDLGKNEVKMYVTDANGNQTYCRTYVIIQNNNNRIPDCEPDTTGGGGGTAGPVITYSELGGEVLTDMGRPVPGTEMTLVAFGQDTSYNSYFDTTITARLDTVVLPNGTTRVEIRIDTNIIVRFDTVFGDRIVNQLTGRDGKFGFGPWRDGLRYRLSGDKTGDILEGIDVMDALKLIQYLIGAEELGNPYRYLAADVNGDGTVSYADFEILYNVIMGVQPNFPIGKNWWIIPADHQFAEPKDPWKTPVPDHVMIDPLRKNLSIPFIGVKIGELDGTIKPRFTQTLTQQRSAEAWWFDLKDEQIGTGETFEIHLDLSLLTAGHLDWAFDNSKASLLKTSFDESVSPMDRSFLLDGSLRIGFAGQEGITLMFQANQELRISDWMDGHMIKGMVYDLEKRERRPVVRFSGETSLLQVTAYPNPFRDGVWLEAISDRSGEGRLRIIDITGRVLYDRPIQLEKGLVQLFVPGEALPGAGFYIYEVQQGKEKRQGKLQRLD